MAGRQRQSQIEIGTRSPSMQRALEALSLAAQSQAPIMLRAEIGSEVAAFARLVHDNSQVRKRSFLWLSCPSLSELPSRSLLTISGGTLFLDEVGGLSDGLQTSLVQVLERLSEQRSRLRIISATKRALEAGLNGRGFREDLFFRLNVVDIRIPPLRERPEDILPLARHFVTVLSTDLGRSAPALSEDAAAMLLQHPWPANVRELKNVVERALLIWPGDILEPEAFTEIRTADVHRQPRVGDDVTLHDLEREHILRLLNRVPGVKAAAAILGVDETTVWRRRKQYERETETEIERSKAR